MLTLVYLKGGKQAAAICKHLQASGIFTPSDLADPARVAAFRDCVLETVAPSSAKTYFAAFRALVTKYLPNCAKHLSGLRTKAAKPVKIALTAEELEALEGVRVRKPEERYVLDEFLVTAWTGLRISDAEKLTEEDIHGEFLTYVSKKMHVRAVVPLREGIAGKILALNSGERLQLSLAGYNKILRRLCRRAGIRSQVKVFKAGRERTGEKWQFVSSHTGRITFCTRLANAGVGVYEIAKMAGHTNTAMTERYIVRDAITLSDAAVDFFKK